jgi:hypothetical protein
LIELIKKKMHILLMQGYDYFRIEGREDSSMGCLFPNRRKKASDWINKFQHMVLLDGVYSHLLSHLSRCPGVISLWGTTGYGRSAIVRKIYYKQLLIEGENSMPSLDWEYDESNTDLGFRFYSWIEVPHPFDLTDLCWRMLLDFYSDDTNKETFAVGLMSGESDPDPVQRCRTILHDHRCLVVVRGLQSTHDWDSMKFGLLSSGSITGCILVITNEESVARHCVGKDGEGAGPMNHYRVHNMTGLGLSGVRYFTKLLPIFFTVKLYPHYKLLLLS